jgi:hypothetical protein
LLPALSIGIATVVAPHFILQLALGAGIASSKAPRPVIDSIKSLATHTVFGLGLYLAALATAESPHPLRGIESALRKRPFMRRRVKGFRCRPAWPTHLSGELECEVDQCSRICLSMILG